MPRLTVFQFNPCAKELRDARTTKLYGTGSLLELHDISQKGDAVGRPLKSIDALDKLTAHSTLS